MVLVDELAVVFEQAVAGLVNESVLPSECKPPIILNRPKDKAHGDFACNVAMVLAKSAKMNPRQLAERIVAAVPNNALIERLEVAGAGFINVFLRQDTKFALLATILKQGERFGLSDVHRGKKIQVEFVSANPTSALHVGHGRGAAYGMSLANLLEATGYEVWREYYVNDAGRQMDILATSAYLRYLQRLGEPIVFASSGYQGDYIYDIAQAIIDRDGDRYHQPWQRLVAGVPADVVYQDDTSQDDKQNTAKHVLSGDKEAHIDGLIAQSKTLLGSGYAVFHQQALATILADIQSDLTEFGVVFDSWFSEKSIEPMIDEVLKQLDDKGFLYEKDGNLWFKSTQFGDEKDRVVRRSNGQPTYFASDIAYHKHKFERGFDTVINVWGADHHGYVARIKGALSALGIDPERLEVPLVQFVSLYRGDEKIAMSSRAGQFITLRELREEVGNDAARYYYASRTPNVPMDFDLALAKSQSRDNAVYYIQYAHARICRVLEKMTKFGYQPNNEMAKQHLAQLDNDQENALLKRLSAYPDTVLKAADSREPHLLANYLKDLAGEFHVWYNDNRILPKSLETDTVLEDELGLMYARVYLSQAVQQVLANGLSLLGLSAPKFM